MGVNIMNKKIFILSIIGILVTILILLFVRKLYLIDKIMKNVAKNNEITNYRISKH